uniref:Uncharacterized protein n=1 Tax=Plectus sambesii TaxID=2011161 RepID=A0A914VFD4_9BILA
MGALGPNARADNGPQAAARKSPAPHRRATTTQPPRCQPNGANIRSLFAVRDETVGAPVPNRLGPSRPDIGSSQTKGPTEGGAWQKQTDHT